LRRFIELSIEGKIENTDDVIAVYEEPDIETPVQTPVRLQDEESGTLKSYFLRSSFRYIAAGLALLTLFGLLLFYNLRYAYEGSGIVTGNDRKIYPLQSAVVSGLYVREGERVKAGDPLLQLDSSAIRYQLSLLESQKREAMKRYELAKKRQTEERVVPNSGLIRLLEKRVALAYGELQNAKKQYAGRLITKSVLEGARRRWLDAGAKLERARVDSRLLRKKLAENPGDTQAPDTEESDVRIDYLKNLLKQYRITAPVEGIVYEIYATEGQQAQPSTPVMALWVRQKPTIVVNIPNSYLSDISAGEQVDIVDKKSRKSYSGIVKKIGSVNENLDAERFSVTIEPSVSLDTLAPHQRVEVLFKRAF
jgi:HlyD family secretion protein